MEARYQTVEEPQGTSFANAWGDVSGVELDPKQVRKARAEEIEYVHKTQLYDKVPIKECYNRTGKGPITVRWIYINKGDRQSLNDRSMLVAREMNTYKRDDLFAATPPFEALKLILSMAATANKREIIMIDDSS